MTMLETAEIVSGRYGISREAQDDYSVKSQQRTAQAQSDGLFDDEIVPMTAIQLVTDKATGETREQEVTLSLDEGNRPQTTLTDLAKLKPVFKNGQQIKDGGFITAGNASQLSDGAAALVLMEAKEAERRGLEPLGRLSSASMVAGCDPDEMGIGPVFAIPKLLKAHGPLRRRHRRVAAQRGFRFVQVIYCRDKLGIPDEKLNATRRGDLHRPSLRHEQAPAWSGTYIAARVNAAKAKDPKVKYGVVTMCVGGGMEPPACSRSTEAGGEPVGQALAEPSLVRRSFGATTFPRRPQGRLAARVPKDAGAQGRRSRSYDMREDTRFYIDGQWVAPAGRKTLDVINPANEEVAGHILLGTAEDVDAAARAARRAFPAYAALSVEERIAMLETIVAGYTSRWADIAAAVTEEMGAPAKLSMQAQAGAGMAHLQTALAVLKAYKFKGAAWSHPDRQGAHRRGRHDHALELADEPGDDQARPGAGGRLHRGAEAFRGRTLLRPHHRRNPARRRAAAGCVQPG